MQFPHLSATLAAALTTFATIGVQAQATASAPAPAPAAAPLSNVTVYGLIDAVVRRVNNVVASDTSDTVTRMEDGLVTGSRLGFRGSEDLGQGWRASFIMESGFDPSNGTSLQATPTADYGQDQANPRFWGREVNVTLSSPWAGLTLGRQYTTAHQIAARFQPQANPNNLALSVFSSHHIARQDNVARLATKLGATELMATRTFGEQADSTANGSWSVGGVYVKPTYAFGAYVQEMYNRADTDERRIIGLGGNYRFHPVFALYTGYMQRDSKVSPQENKVWALGANIEVTDPVTITLEYFNDDQSGSAALEGSRKVAWASATYRFSRRTDMYFTVDHNKVEGGYALPSFMATKGTQTAYNLALRTRF